MAGMSATDRLRENGCDITIPTNIVVIGRLAETGLARRYQVLYRERTSSLTASCFSAFICMHGSLEIAGLDDDSTEDRGDNGGNDLQHLFDC